MKTLGALSWHRIIADVLILVLAAVFACALHFLRVLGWGQEYFAAFMSFPETATASVALRDFDLRLRSLLPVVPIALIVFATHGFYTASALYRGRFKSVLLVEAVTSAYVLYAAVVFLSAPSYNLPRFVYLTALFTSAALLCASRMYAASWKSEILVEDRQLRRSGLGPIERVMVVGGAGYIGSELCRQLLAKNYLVRVLDPLIYGDAPIADLRSNPRFELVVGDSRSVEAVVSAFRDVDAVIHLGAIVGDPACALDERLTIEINLVSTRMMAEVAKGYGVRRFVFASTCSVYGASDERLDESSELNPVSLYARTKIQSEQVLMGMIDSAFSPVIFRFATIYGLSPRPRFDLAVNLLTAKATTDGSFTVFGGEQWRPFVHVTDVARALVMAIELDDELVRGQIFNIGSNEQNYQMKDIGRLVERMVPGSQMKVDESSPDRRNYWVRFDKAEQVIGFRPTRTVDDGIGEIATALRSGRIADYKNPLYNNFAYLTDEQARDGITISDPIFAPNALRFGAILTSEVSDRAV